MFKVGKSMKIELLEKQRAHTNSLHNCIATFVRSHFNFKCEIIMLLKHNIHSL